MVTGAPPSSGGYAALAFAWLALLPGCSGANEDTLLDELRVLAMIADAPEIAPMETTRLRVRVVDPAGQGGRVLVWTCTRLGETCLEDEEGRTVTTQVPDEAGWVEVSVTASPALAAVAGPEPLPLLQAFALACEADACPLLDAVDAGEAVDAEVWANPFDWMDELPLQGTSLAFTTLRVSARAPDDRHANPTVTAEPEADEVEVAGTLAVDVRVEGELGEEAKVWGYAEAGGFAMTDRRPGDDRQTRMDWVAPAEPGRVPLYLLLVDGLGGSALWEGSVSAIGG